jgi:hypothetical protein
VHRNDHVVTVRKVKGKRNDVFQSHIQKNKSARPVADDPAELGSNELNTVKIGRKGDLTNTGSELYLSRDKSESVNYLVVCNTHKRHTTNGHILRATENPILARRTR